MLTQCKEAKEIFDYLPLLIRLTYLLGTRVSETIDLRYSNCKESGLYIKRRKGSKDNIIAWSPALKDIIDEAKILNKTKGITDFGPPIITNTKGDSLTLNVIHSAMSRLKTNMKDKDLGDIFFTLHKIRLKAQCDSKDSNILGLSSPMDRYNTKVRVIKTGLK